MKTLLVVSLLLALAAPAHAVTCTGHVKIDVADGQGLGIKGDKVLGVGACDFGDPALSVLAKRVLRTCPLGSHCRIEGTISGDAEIETITGVIRDATPKGEWFLLLDAWTCSNKSCADPGSSYEDLVIKETFATQKQCLVKGRRLSWMHHNPSPGMIAVGGADSYRYTPDESMLYEVINGDTFGMPIGGFHPRCEWHRQPSQ